MPADLPGFYFDPDRNRYFPIPRGIGSKARIPTSSQGTDELSGRRSEESRTGPSSLSHTGFKKNDLLHLVHCREANVYEGLIRFGNTPQYFKRQCLEAYACCPKVWKYGETNKRADGALEVLDLDSQTDEGETLGSILLLGGSNGRLSACASTSSTAAQLNQGVLNTPYQCLPSNCKLWSGNEKPLTLKHVGDDINFASKLTAIRSFGKTSNTASLEQSQWAIVTTLGSGESGGTLFLIRLKSKCGNSNRIHARSEFCMHVSGSVRTRTSVWTADCSAQGRTACLGTSKGAALIYLQSSFLTWICHSKSDLLALQFESTGNVVLCGFRNGLISTVDVRVPPQQHRRQVSTAASHGRNLNLPRSRHFRNSSLQNEGAIGSFRGRHPKTRCISDENLAEARTTCGNVNMHSSEMRMKSALCSIMLLPSDERYFLASAMNGTICLWDRRMVQKGVVRNYEGLFNSHTDLDLGVDPSETLLVSGGEDCTICIWSLASGHLLHKEYGLSSPAKAVCWPKSCKLKSSLQWNGLVESSLTSEHPWGMFFGSYDGLLYMHGGAH